MSDDRLRRAYAEELKQGYLKTGFKQGFEAGYAKAKKDFERPHGEWYYNYQNGWHCSNCHESVKDMPTVMGKANFAFCPNCGSDNRKKVKIDD